MSSKEDRLGRLIAVFGISAVHVQRAAFLAGLSLLFSATTTLGFLLTLRYVFLLLAAGFLVIGLSSLVTTIVRKRSVVRLYEGGIQFRKFEFLWSDIQTVEWVIEDSSLRLEIRTVGGRKVLLPASIADTERLKAMMVRQVRPPVGEGHLN